MSFAEGTSVPVERSKAEIEGMLTRYGADQFVSGWAESEARIQFRANGRYVRFVLPIPDKTEKRFTHQARYDWKPRTQGEAVKAWEQELRRLWRALALVVKAKLEAVQSGIVGFEDEFMAHIVMPDGQTVAEHARPLIAEAYKTGKVAALLPGW
ncbi:MAG: hypothetical protein Q8N00_11270 [Nitrospirota bacterium]|nr:hypothetical protein [Nitrospirota bacterium]